MSHDLDIAGRIGYLLATHDRLRRVLTLAALIQLWVSWLIAAAPPAAASTLAVALSWTGLHDTQGVPLGAYYLSVVDTGEAITNRGPGPQSLAAWTTHAFNMLLSHQLVVSTLDLEAGAYLFLMGIALWVLRFAMSSTWLAWLATWFRPLLAIMTRLLADLWVFPICLTLAVGVGAYHILWHGRRGFGWGIILSSFAIGVVGMVLSPDPLTDLYSDTGLLNQGRNLGFSIAQAAVTNGPITAGAAPTTQLDTLTAEIIDATVRAPFQLWNFGMVVDGVGSCGPAWSAAIRAQQPDGPAHAMAACGAPQALSYAQHLDMGNAILGLVYCLLGLVFAVFVLYVAYSYVLVAAKAFLNALLAIPAAMAAMIYGRPRQRGWRRVRLFFKHAMLVFAYVAYISVATLVLLKIASPGGYADQVGMTHPLARLVMIALGAAVAIGLFRWMKRELGDHSHQDLVSGVHDLHHYAHDGYQRGRDTSDRARQRYHDWASSSTSEQDDDGGDPNQPLTGSPAPGRSQFNGFRADRRPEGDPPAPGRSPSPTDTPAPSAAASGEEAAAVVAPEVVIPAAAAVAAQRHRRDSQTSQPSNRDLTGAVSDQPIPASPRAASLASAAHNLSADVGPTAASPPEGIIDSTNDEPVPGRQRMHNVP
jgi:hypothetical protein